MSYILDALRKADAERQRGHVPDLNSPAPTSPAAAAPTHRAALPAGWLWGAGVVVALAAVLGWWLRPAAPAPTPESGSQTQAPQVEPQPQARPVPPTAVAPPPQARVAPPPLRRPPPVAAPTPVPAPAPAQAAAPAPAATPDAVLPWARVSPALKARLPPLNFGGSMYSSDAKARMVVISGQAVHEGDTVGGGAVVVERIGEHAAQLRFQDQRFMWPYRP